MKLRDAGAIAILLVSISCATKKSSLSTDNLQPRNWPVQVSEVAPDFSLENQHNQRVTLSSARGNMPTVLVFYRGNW